MKYLKHLTRDPLVVILAVMAVMAVIAVLLPHGPGSIPVMGIGFAGMILDAQTTLSDAQALSATAYSSNTFDTLLAGRLIDIGEAMGIEFTIDVAAKTSNADETYKIGIIQSANADLSSEDVLYETNVTYMNRAFFTAGKKFALPIPYGLKTKRYLGIKYTLGGTTPTMTVTAEILPLSFLENQAYYASGFVISS